MRPAVKDAINECRERQAALVIEGTHCLPGLYLDLVDVHVVLKVARDTLLRRYAKDKTRRGSTPLPDRPSDAIARNLEIQDWLLSLSAQSENGVVVVDAEYLPAAFIQIVQLIPTQRIPHSSRPDY